MNAEFTPPVTVVVPVLNGELTLRDCLTSLLALDYPVKQREILVVDNGSTDRTPEIIKRAGLRRVPEPVPGLSRARNRGIEAASTDFVVFMDGDCVVTRGWLRALTREFEDPTVGVAAGEMLTYPPRTAAQRYYARRKPYWQLRSLQYPGAPWFLSGNAAIRRAVFDCIGRFDTGFAGGGCEDIDFAWRFFDSNSFRLVYCPKAVAFHRHRETARGLYRQYRSYGRGQANLSLKYPGRIPWTWRSEFRAYLDLGSNTLRLGRTGVVAVLDKKRRDEFAETYFDLVRKVGERIGFTAGKLARSRR